MLGASAWRHLLVICLLENGIGGRGEEELGVGC